jgi:hypothetical protein
MPSNPSSSGGLPNNHPDPLRSHPSVNTAPNKYIGSTHTQASFIFSLTNEYPTITKEQCLFVLNNDINLGYCKEGPEGVYHWDNLKSN